MPPELHHPIGRRPRRHEVAGIAQFAVGEGASDASEAAASSTYASPWGSLCCWRTARPRWCGARLPDHPTAGVGGWHSHNSSSGVSVAWSSKPIAPSTIMLISSCYSS
uniref:Uncharacterized protein n=1 Tax=Triticum urartu TaxID=4572 RepID=A0A8R7VHW7_TRIUA